MACETRRLAAFCVQEGPVRPGRDVGRPDGLFESLPEISGNDKKEEVLRFHKTSSLVQRNIRHPNFLG